MVRKTLFTQLVGGDVSDPAERIPLRFQLTILFQQAAATFVEQRQKQLSLSYVCVIATHLSKNESLDFAFEKQIGLTVVWINASHHDCKNNKIAFHNHNLTLFSM